MALSTHQLHEFAFIFGILGNIVSFGVYLAPLPTFWRIYKKKSTQEFQAIPYSVALFSAMLLLYYAFLKEDDATMIITINTIGCAIEGFYLIVYMIYAPKKARVKTAKLLALFNVAALGAIVLVTMLFVRGSDQHHILSRGGNREKAVGWICAVFSVCVFAAPLSVMRMVIRTKSVEFMPFWLSFSLTLCAVMWFFYGFLIRDFYIALPNILGFLFGITQMILYMIYKDSKKLAEADLGLKQADLKQLQDLAVDIKLGNIEMIGAADVTTFDHTTNGAPPQVIEVILDDAVTQENDRGENDVVAEEGNGKLPGKSEKVGSEELPRGEYIV